MLPVGAIIVGGIALLLAAYAAVTLTQLKKSIAEQDTKLAKIDTVENAANAAASAAEKTAKDLKELQRSTQNAFNDVGPILVDLQGKVTKLEATAQKPVAQSSDKKGGKGPVVAGPGEYVVKPGDASGAKIARDHGISLADLQAVNPGVNWNRMKIGDKLKLPAKK